MSRPNNVERFVSWALIMVAIIAIAFGYVRLDNNQEDVRAEAVAREEAQCATETRILGAIEEIVEFATAPVSTAGLEPGRVPVAEELNRDRAETRKSVLALLPVPTCVR